MVARKRTTARKAASARTATRRTTNRRTATRRAAKKSTAKKTATKTSGAKKMINRNAVHTAWTKSELYGNIANNVDLTKKQVSAVFDELQEIIGQHIKKGAAGEFNLAGLFKVTMKTKPARKARKGTNPFTGEEMMFKAKPASRVIKVRPLKKLKDIIA